MVATSPAVARDSPPIQPGAGPARTRAELLAYVILFLAVVLIVFANRWGQISPDWVPQLYLAPVKTFLASLSAWRSEPFLGQPNIHAGLAPTAAVISLIRLPGVPAWVAIRIFRILMLVTAGWGSMRLFDRLAGGASGPVGRVSAAAVYAANPFVIVSGSWMPTLLPYALFPWLLLCLDHSVRQPKSWRWPAGFALVFFAMGGVNGGVVPVILAGLGVPAYLAYALLAGIVPLRGCLSAAGRCLVLSLSVSFYWIAPTLFGQGSGSSIAFTTERPIEVAAPSSYSEAIRLLGFWLMYGYRPNQASYGANPLVLIATFLLPAAALLSLWLSRSRLRMLASILLAIGIPVMVGMFPADALTPFGRALGWAFEHVPGAIAFRTTTKAGALPALALALMIGLGAQEVARSGLHAAVKAGVASLAGLVFALTLYPALSGALYPSGWRVPAYWQQAADDLNSLSRDSRVLFLPGNYLAVYRWGMREVEDLNEALLDRPSVVRTVLVYGSPYGANLLSAVDTSLEMGGYSKGTVPSVARYLGASHVLLRNDMVWEESGGARPFRLALELYEPGLRLARSYGKAGENVVKFPTDDRLSPVWSDQQLPPLQRFSVTSPRPTVRAEPVSGAVLVDGDNFALGSLVEARLLEGEPSFRLLGSMDPDQLVQAARDGARIVLTDSNRRRIWTFRRTDQDSSATLSAEEGRGRRQESYALFWDRPDAQTVARLEGVRAIDSSGYGSVFGPVPSSRPALAFDGDFHTAWLVGDYGTGIGNWIRIQLERPTTLSHLELRPVVGYSVEVSSVRITVGSRSFDITVPDRTSVPISFPPTRANSVRIQIKGTRGVGTNPVGFREISIPGVHVTETVRMPRTFASLVRELSDEDRAVVLGRPLDVLLTRQLGDPGIRSDDEERALVREFVLPGAGTFSLSGLVQAGPDLSDRVIDELAGFPSDVVATSSAREFGSIFTRASQTLDGDLNTAWVPSGPGDRIHLAFPPQRLRSFVVRQGQPGKPSASFASEATVSVNGGPPFPVRLTPHDTEIRFRRQRIRTLDITITRIDGLGGEVRVGEISIGDVRVPRTDESTSIRRCVDLFTMDGRNAQASVRGTLGLLASGAMPLTSCDESPLSLAAGEHRLRAKEGWLIDRLRLTSSPPATGTPSTFRGRGFVAGESPSRLTVISSSSSRIVVKATRAGSPYYLVTGQAYDDRWRATMDGRSLGKPIVVDGYSVGWRIDDLDPHHFVISFQPQRWVTMAQIVSVLALGLIVLLFLKRRREPSLDVPPLGAARGREREGGRFGAFPAGNPASNPRRGFFALMLVALLFFIGGWSGLAAGAASALILFGTRRLAARFPRRFSGRDAALLIPAALLTAIPFVLLFNGLPASWQVTSTLVRENILASYLAQAALVLAVAATIRDVRGGMRPS